MNNVGYDNYVYFFLNFYITKVTDPTPSPSPTREGSCCAYHQR